MLGYDPKGDNSLTGQEDFNFDDDARGRSEKQLRIDLPELLIGHRDGVRFVELIEATCNSTPATTDIYRNVLNQLIEDKDIVVTSPDGARRRKGQSVKDGDIIRVSQTLSLFFRKPQY